jgi:hypothetical protein
MKIKSVAFFSIAVIALLSVAQAGDIYIAQSSAGADSGADCADAHSAAWFNSNASGGNTYHLCGTFSGTSGVTMLSVPVSGTASSPLIILFERGAIMRSPRWPAGTYLDDGSSGGAIAVSNKNYVIIDGGSNGVIANEDSNGSATNGTGKANAKTSYGVYLRGSNLIVRNLTIRNIYVINGNDTSTPATDTADIHIDSPATNISICNNTLNNSMQGIMSFATGSGPQNNDCQSNTFAAGLNFFLNSLDDHGWQMAINPSGAAAPNIYANSFGSDENWANGPSASIWHTDGVIAYPTVSNVVITPYIYNNVFNGALANGVAGDGSPTGFVFCTYGAGYSNSGAACSIFNNVIVSTLTNGGAAAMWLGGDSGYVVGPHKIFNNTIVNNQWNITGTNSAASASWYTIQNNIIRSVQSGQFLFDNGISSSKMLNINFNVYYNTAQQSWDWHGISNSFANWKSSCSAGGGNGCDSASVYGDPQLDSSYQLTSASNAKAMGTNLSSLCTGQMAPLCYDKPPSVGKGGSLVGSNQRPSSGAWDAGAYQYSSGSGAQNPAPPTGLAATVQ